MNRRLIILLAAAVVVAAATPVPAGDDADLYRLNLLWTSDIHGHIAPEGARYMNPQFPPPMGGAASAMTYIESVREQARRSGEGVLLVDVGDIFQGTPVGNKTKGMAVIDYFNAAGFDFVVPGNHDFDMGRENCERLARASRMPWLCCNLRDEKTGEIVDWCRPTAMREFDGIRIGFIGAITPATKQMSFPANVAGLIFDPLVPTVSRYRDELRAQGADLIFLFVHEGLPRNIESAWQRLVSDAETDQEIQNTATPGYGHVASGYVDMMELVHEVSGIDVAVGGHTHVGYNEPWIDPVTHTICFECYPNGSSVGHAVLLIDRRTRTLLGYRKTHDRGVLVNVFEDELWPDERMREVLAPSIEKAEAAMNTVIGEAASALTRGGPGENPVGNLVTDAMREYFDADFAFQNLGGLRADIPAGPITTRTIFSVLPFGNELVVVRMKGALIRRILERKLRGNSGGLCISGAKITFSRERPDWDRLCSVLIGDEPLDYDRTYRAVCTNYLIEGNSGLDFLAAIPDSLVELSQIKTSEAVERYVRRHSPLKPRIDDRWVEEPDCTQAPYLEGPYLPERQASLAPSR